MLHWFSQLGDFFLISVNQASRQMTTESILLSDLSDTIIPPNYEKYARRKRGQETKGKKRKLKYGVPSRTAALFMEEN